MKKGLRILVWALSVLILLSLFACGGGNGGDNSDETSSITPPSEDPVGTYKLTDALVVYEDGTRLTKNDLGASGSMKIGNSTISQTIVIGNESISMSGTYEVIYTNWENTEGVVRVSDASGVHDIAFTIDGLYLTTYTIAKEPITGMTFEEWDTWRKTSNIVTAQSISPESLHGSWQWFGNLIKQKVD